jgi:type II secretory pathway pseudopilin PulG
MVFIAVMGIVLASAGEIWHMALKREKERELLFVGDQFRRAINQYYQNSPLKPRRFPMSLDDLLKDPRYPGTQRYLRKIYIDPMTGDSKWGLVTGPAGEIFGVYSLSEDEPIKKSNFSSADSNFEGKTKYAEWVFLGVPERYVKPLVKAALEENRKQP